MKILIIGDYPGFFGGVTNYTRPLAEILSKYVEVSYLYNCTRTGNYDFGKQRIVDKTSTDLYKSYELVNGKADYVNYNSLELDYNGWFDELFEDFLNQDQPDYIHINEIFGFSSNIINISKKRGIKVIVTVHEYWWLCPHRVMVDYNRKICPGPQTISKCSHCINVQIGNDINYSSPFRKRLRHVLPNLVKLYKGIRKSLSLTKKPVIVDLSFGEETYPQEKNIERFNSIKNRLANNINNLNKCDKIIGVSSDVKNILSAYGVNPEKIIVQHIGSTIAGNKIKHIKLIEDQTIVFGFIGGVGYYKGVHQLVEAFFMLPEELQQKAKIEIWGKGDENYIYSINKQHIVNKTFAEHVTFKGGFTPSDLQIITNRIDISVLPSLCADTAPQTIFESFSSGLPIIAPNIGGFPDFVIENNNGLIYDAADARSLSLALKKIIENPTMLEIFKKNIKPLKGIEENVAQLIDLYKSL